jgi:hypothetical protein
VGVRDPIRRWALRLCRPAKHHQESSSCCFSAAAVATLHSVDMSSCRCTYGPFIFTPINCVHQSPSCAMDGDAIQLFAKGKRKRVPNTDSSNERGSNRVDERVGKKQAAGGDEDEQQQVAEHAEQGQASTSQPEYDEDASFKDLGLSDWLCGVLQSLGITLPTPVQHGCIPAVLAGRDVIGTAQTGSGKTAAFALPILQKLAKDPYGVFALVLTPTRCDSGLRLRRRPARCCAQQRSSALVGGCAVLSACCTLPAALFQAVPPHLTSPVTTTRPPPPCNSQSRELAVQLAEQFGAFGAGMSLRACVVIGGVEQQAQAKQLARRPHVVIATPGRLAELIATDAGICKGFSRTRCARPPSPRPAAATHAYLSPLRRSALGPAPHRRPLTAALIPHPPPPPKKVPGPGRGRPPAGPNLRVPPPRHPRRAAARRPPDAALQRDDDSSIGQAAGGAAGGRTRVSGLRRAADGRQPAAGARCSACVGRLGAAWMDAAAAWMDAAEV